MCVRSNYALVSHYFPSNSCRNVPGSERGNPFRANPISFSTRLGDSLVQTLIQRAPSWRPIRWSQLAADGLGAHRSLCVDGSPGSGDLEGGLEGWFELWLTFFCDSPNIEFLLGTFHVYHCVYLCLMLMTLIMFDGSIISRSLSSHLLVCVTVLITSSDNYWLRF